jgi:hypothetical protein
VVETSRGHGPRDPKTGAGALAPGAVVATLRLADYILVRCRARHRIAVMAMDGDSPAAMRRNGFAVPVSDALLGMVASQPLGPWAVWTWDDWCGSRAFTSRPDRPWSSGSTMAGR